MPSRLVVIRHSGLRQVEESAALLAVSEELRLAGRDVIHVDTQQFANNVAAGEWSGHDAYLRDRAAEVHRVADAADEPELHYAGLAQIPHVIALGAAIGDERTVVVHEYDRDQDSWRWPNDNETVPVVVDNAAAVPAVTTAGVAVLRVAISAVVQDSDVRAVVGDETLADVTVRFEDGAASVARVRSAEQLQVIRVALRDAIAGIKNCRPGVQTLHLFVAAPNSVCFVLGQELVPRNTPPIQTYIYRIGAGPTSYHQAILITNRQPEDSARSFTEDERELAGRLRKELWTRALDELKRYAAKKRAQRVRMHRDTGPWYVGLEPSAELARAAPFPCLPPVHELVHPDDEIDPEPFYQDYGYDPERHLWRLGDGLVLGLHRAAGQDDSRALAAVRLFFFHEYVHAYHTLSKYTAAGVGKFANALERLDYSADTYAVLHELDLQRRRAKGRKPTRRQILALLADQVDQVLRSFWAFDGTGPHNRMQVRRVRRYLNWYWRMAQLRRANTVQEAVSLFVKSPAVELAGVPLETDGERRVYCKLSQPRSQRPEVAIVLEDEKLVRITEGDATSLVTLIEAFKAGDHEGLTAWFRPVYEFASNIGAVHPALHPLIESEYRIASPGKEPARVGIRRRADRQDSPSGV